MTTCCYSVLGRGVYPKQCLASWNRPFTSALLLSEMEWYRLSEMTVLNGNVLGEMTVLSNILFGDCAARVRTWGFECKSLEFPIFDRPRPDIVGAFSSY